jgi:hypothetical protein
LLDLGDLDKCLLIYLVFFLILVAGGGLGFRVCGGRAMDFEWFSSC